ncbi:MAG: hypothetical protein UU49_C0001G0007 [Candidatus Magasanikbacteria bacterium GW2011_GWC2_41_17]|uniref:Capsular polysaccharide biosynthesis protein n=2 Tax=Candidatus Magasanikiibacteriota TaxID=1752731 RepID=A0A0G0ZKZ4_9BACT|nr:MAG: hypothetical protein UU49_C0001G0007 [Candidatus Magasanikbacteria bacterium GW2011_GWC2_41_17]KKS13628.1 MAG: hypothetical protein UU69_C0001G0005 [Candidatus Magasanikbacteria bacterium GW2011_GWA2_41_55]
MRIFLIEWDAENKEFIDVVTTLKQRGHEILYWTYGDNKEVSSECKKNFSDTIFHHRQDAMAGKPAAPFVENEFLPVGEDVIEKLYRTESILQTMKHYEKMPLTTIEKKHLFYEYLRYWRGLLQLLKPEVIIFNVWPHSSYSFITYAVAKFLGIKTLMFEAVRVDGRLILIDDYEKGSQDLKDEISRNKNKIIKIDELSDITRRYYQSHLKKNSDVKPPDFKFLYRNFAGIGLLKKRTELILSSSKDFSIFKKFFLYLSKIFGDNLHKEYSKLTVEPDLNKKFIYFGLHYQPECSTSPLGGLFVDQILAIQILSASLPSDWLIYVKEHPWQWLTGGINFTNFRYKGYYNPIAQLKNVRLISTETDSIVLIEKAQVVATISGTGGWEGLMRLKPVIVFGYPWYRDCVGVFKVNSVDTCKKAFAQIVSVFEIKQQEITNFLYSLDQVSCRGYLEELYREQAQISVEENSKNLTRALLNELDKK